MADSTYERQSRRREHADGPSTNGHVPTLEEEYGNPRGPDPEHIEPDVLEFFSAARLAATVDNAAPVGWLCQPVWPADAYGVLAAEHKAGKTWADLDMAVSVASGTPWLDTYPVETSGPVLVFLGEGGPRKMLRRLRAVCESKDVAFEELPIELCFRVPHLGAVLHMECIERKLAAQRPALVIIDPLYLAARGAKSSSLFDMGAHLEVVQTLAQAAGAALAVIHHWNQTGTGKGAERMSGAGPAEWGRVLASVAVESRHTDPTTKASNVVLGWTFIGDEIPDTEIRIRRDVWADDPDDLNSPLHYRIEKLDPAGARTEAEPWNGPTRCMDDIEALLTGTGQELSQRQLATQLRAAGHSYRDSTVTNGADRLVAEGRLTVRAGPRKARLYSFTETPNDPIF